MKNHEKQWNFFDFCYNYNVDFKADLKQDVLGLNYTKPYCPLAFGKLWTTKSGLFDCQLDSLLFYNLQHFNV